MIAAARIGPGSHVLEIGAGSGYAAAILAHLAASVIAIERHEALAKEASRRIDAFGLRNCTVLAGDGMAGRPGDAPFDAILVAARGAEVPEPLKRQLAIGGDLVIPVGGEDRQTLRQFTRKSDDSWEFEDLDEVRFVPLLPGEVRDD